MRRRKKHFVATGPEKRAGGLACTGIAKEDKVLARRYLGQALLLAHRLHLQEREKPSNLILHSLQAHEICEFLLNLSNRTGRAVHPWLDLLEPFSGRTKRAPKLRPDQAKPGEENFNWTSVG